MPSDETVRRFRDIVENIDRIERHCEGLSEREFARDPLVMDAVERCLQRITEASIHVQPFAPDNFPMQDRVRYESSAISCTMATKSFAPR